MLNTRISIKYRNVKEQAYDYTGMPKDEHYHLKRKNSHRKSNIQQSWCNRHRTSHKLEEFTGFTSTSQTGKEVNKNITNKNIQTIAVALRRPKRNPILQTLRILQTSITSLIISGPISAALVALSLYREGVVHGQMCILLATLIRFIITLPCSPVTKHKHVRLSFSFLLVLSRPPP
jgi:hypothetical protein